MFVASMLLLDEGFGMTQIFGEATTKSGQLDPLRHSLLQQLDRSVRRHTAGRYARLFRRPLETVRRSLVMRSLQRSTKCVETTARPFFGQSMAVTIPPAEELWLC